MDNSDGLAKAARARIIAAVVGGIVVIAAISYFIFGIPAWLAIFGAAGAVFLNGVALLFGRKKE